jgi:hypothetical protein
MTTEDFSPENNEIYSPEADDYWPAWKRWLWNSIGVAFWLVIAVCVGAMVWAVNAYAETADHFKPSYPVHVIPDFRDADGKPIEKGDVAETDVSVVCAGKGAYKSVSHRGGTYSQNHRLSQNDKTKRAVMQQSGVPWKDRSHYEDDHYCPLGAGCSDSIKNRWAQPRFGAWNAAQKDKLETRAIELACAGSVPLKTVQGWFKTEVTPDWRVPYCKLFGADDPDCAALAKAASR